MRDRKEGWKVEGQGRGGLLILNFRDRRRKSEDSGLGVSGEQSLPRSYDS
jgi:hypothetical protein